MSSGFHRSGDTIEVTFEGEEAIVLRRLVGELVELLRSDLPEREAEPGDPVAALIGDYSGPSEQPEDEVLARLLPNAYSDDEGAAAEFRRFTERGLRDGKVANARVVLEALGDPDYADKMTVVIKPDEVDAWLRTLTDVRLAIGTRLGVADNDEERWSSLPEDDPNRYVHHLYLWLGWLQETLVDSLL